MLADELKKVQTPFIKRHTKKQLLETVFAAQEQEEQLVVPNAMQPATTDAAAADNTSPCNYSKHVSFTSKRRISPAKDIFRPRKTVKDAQIRRVLG